jgi:dipeptide/tripeptide permease
MLFSSTNYKLLGLGILLITFGFLAMYWENEVEGFISLYVSPIMIIAGYVVILFSILKKKETAAIQSSDE